MFTVLNTRQFDKWFGKLRDYTGKARIAKRIDTIKVKGHFGDTKSLGDGIEEMRIFTGPGYRMYFARVESTIILLLLGGDKDTQDEDIKTAKAIWKEMQEDGD